LSLCLVTTYANHKTPILAASASTNSLQCAARFGVCTFCGMRKLSRPLVLVGSVCVLTLSLSVCYARRRRTKTSAVDPAPLAPTPEYTDEARSVVVYDGDCGICEASARWVTSHVASVDVVSHHQYGLTSIDSVWFVAPSGRLEGAAAVSSILKSADSKLYRAVGTAVGMPVLLLAAEIIYKLVARNRRHISRLLGMNACGLPLR
jgi:predicted DCC family thiol-disulfide oxidoreductase YuxK